ncbi:NUDIX hydrolase [Pseudoalteromonas porphyrae]|uniref:NUDIX hydrolase n=2 Tax=Pseudoalteromonas TaxID=53246 RepID=A0A0N0LZR9_9GAMM|nr:MULTISPECIES: CoA pyrophosphatase [Pseudoalteromonas]KPH63221.1 NUDIX hydrolase [Pseudoalteromonas porphyrae]KPH94248.1 NUDIX hydrolase [Pseudoalteromonas porphyrae]
MNSQQLMARFQLSAPINEHAQQIQSIRSKRPQRASAVMLPLIDIDNSAHILLCKRPTFLNHHPGEICLPGGKHELTDTNLRHTALRELNEELNIAPSNVTIVGQLADYSTLTGFTITPYVGLLAPNTFWQADKNEVAASFLLQVSALANVNNWHPINFERFGKIITLQGFSTPYGLLWGATASIIKNFTKQLAIPV